jgi:carbon-monoxide dehydrogenase medium subunit
VRLSPFRLHRPTTVAQATDLLRELGPDALPYCGGTELLLVAKLGLTDFSDLVDLKSIPEISGIEANGSLRIGATTTHREIESSPLVRAGWPSLAEMERRVGNLRVRNVGSIGGNLCFADPHSDPATYLIAAGALVLTSSGREIPVEEFTRGPYATALEPAELVVAVQVPELPADSALVHRKMSFHERPAVTVAVNVGVRDGVVAHACIAVGSVGVVAQRLRRTEETLIGASGPEADVLSHCADTAAGEVEPVEDSNGSVEYKRQLVRVLVRRSAQEAIAQAATA